MKEPISCYHQGKKAIAVGNRIYFIKPNVTFHELCVNIMATEFGKEWYQEELTKSKSKRHIVAQWYLSFCEFTKQKTRDSNKKDDLYHSLPSGDAWSLISLGYDLYSIRHNTKLSAEVITRLKRFYNFQGARYEIAIAAIFARLDFDLEYLDTKSKKHCEFVATHKHSKDKIAVEVKSRHREGVLNQSGKFNPDKKIIPGITRMFNQVLQQQLDKLPFAIFIDLNLPLDNNKPIEKKWWNDLKYTIRSKKRTSSSNPDKYNLLYITNFSYHYAVDRLINTQQYPSDSCMVVPRNPKYPLQNKNIISLINKEVNNYGNIPHDII